MRTWAVFALFGGLGSLAGCLCFVRNDNEIWPYALLGYWFVLALWLASRLVTRAIVKRSARGGSGPLIVLGLLAWPVVLSVTLAALFLGRLIQLPIWTYPLVAYSVGSLAAVSLGGLSLRLLGRPVSRKALAYSVVANELLLSVILGLYRQYIATAPSSTSTFLLLLCLIVPLGCLDGGLYGVGFRKDTAL
jgi:hypothetical protein